MLAYLPEPSSCQHVDWGLSCPAAARQYAYHLPEVVCSWLHQAVPRMFELEFEAAAVTALLYTFVAPPEIQH